LQIEVAGVNGLQLATSAMAASGASSPKNGATGLGWVAVGY
jgi:hypothetical protein